MDKNPKTLKVDVSRTSSFTEVDSKNSKTLLNSEDAEFKVPSEKKKEKGVEKEDIHYRSGLFTLFRYATKLDIILLSIGITFSVIHGASFPILAYVFGQMTDTFISHAEKLKNATASNVVSSPGKFYFFRGLLVAVQEREATIQNRFVDADGDKFTSYLAYYSLNYLYIGIAVLFAAFIQTLCWEMACERQVHRLRQVAFTQILRQDIPWYDTRPQTNLTNVLSDDVERIREGIGCKFSMVTQYLSTFICGILVGVVVNWKLTSMLLLIAPLLIGASGYLAKLTASSAAREQLKYGLAGGVAQEVLSCMRTVAAFGMEPKEIQRYSSALEAGRKLAMRKYVVLAWGLTVVFFLMYAQYGLAFYYGAILIEDGYCTPGSVFTVFFSVLSGAFTLGNALPYVNSVATALGSASSIFSIIDRVPQIDGRILAAGAKPPSLQGYIQFQDVHFSYPSRPEVQVLKGLTLDIYPGQTVAIVGPSGCGKSTVINLLLRFYDVSYGTITVDGRPLNDLNVHWLRSQVGVVSQEPVLFGVSIAENIRYGCETVSQDDIEIAATMANAHSFIEELPQGYNTLVGERGAQLSGGQKQRVCVARALARDPALLLLDEATSALDTESERVIQEALERAMLGRTTVVIAHRLSTVRHANLILVLDKGRVVEQGNHDELMFNHGLYRQLVTTQAVYTSNDIHPMNDINLGVSNNVTVHYLFQPANWMSAIYGPALTPVVQDPDVSVVPRPCRTDISKLSLHLPADKTFLEGEGREITLWVLIKLNRSECSWLLLGLVGCSLGGGIMPIFAFFYGEVFATFTKSGEEMMRAAVFWSEMFVVLGVLAAIGIWLEIVMMTFAVEMLVLRLRLMAFRNILRQPVGWFDLSEHSSGRLITCLARDAPMIKGAAGLRLGQLLSSLVTLVAALTVAFVFGWKLALVLLLVVPLIAGGAYHQTLMLRRTQLRDTKFMDDAGRVASDCVRNIKTVQALCSEQIFLRLYMLSLSLPFREAKKQAVVYSVIFALSQAVIYVMYAGAFRFGAYLIQINDMTVSEVYRVFFALAFCAASVGTSSAYVQDYNKAKMAARQMFRLIERKPEIDAISPYGLKPTISGFVEFNRVVFYYPSRPEVRVLRGLSFAIAPGQTLALVGQSGCGKSTVVCLLERFYTPSSGIVRLDGTDIAEINLQHLRRHIGLVTQEPVLFNRTIKENIAYGVADDGAAEPIMEQVVEAAITANCHSFITELPKGYDTMVGEGGCQLSGGQKQRIAIARALIRDPIILLLDEATSALDTENEKIVQEALDKAREGRTCIIIAHRLSTIQNADMIAVLDRGKIREIGSHEELKSQCGLYYQLVEAQHL